MLVFLLIKLLKVGAGVELDMKVWEKTRKVKKALLFSIRAPKEALASLLLSELLSKKLWQGVQWEQKPKTILFSLLTLKTWLKVFFEQAGWYIGFKTFGIIIA